MMAKHGTNPHEDRGQAMVELALILPLFVVVIFGIITLGLGVFYQQQISNAAREAARFAAISSASNPKCPVVGHLDPLGPEPWLTTTDPITGKTALWPHDLSYLRCDTVQDRWPRMTAFVQSKVFGMPRDRLVLAACWSGYQTNDHYDAPPPGSAAAVGLTPVWSACTINGVDPSTSAGAIACPPGAVAADYSTVDTASSISEGQGRTVANKVTTFACYAWQPPLGGVGIYIPVIDVSITILPDVIPLRAVVSEPIQRQQ